MVEMNEVTSGYVVLWQASVTGAGKAIPSVRSRRTDVLLFRFGEVLAVR